MLLKGGNMSLMGLDLTYYYDIENKLNAQEFLNLLNTMNMENESKEYYNCCITDTLSEIYNANAYEISLFFTETYGQKLAKHSNSNSEEYKLFGVTINTEDLSLVCQQMTDHGYTPLDVVANFAILKGRSTELSLICEVLTLYEDKYKAKQKNNKQLYKKTKRNYRVNEKR